MRDPGRDVYGVPGSSYSGDQPNAETAAVLDDHRRRIGRFPARELDLYSDQLARCLQALGTDAPIRADIQRELATVRAEQESRARANEPGRLRNVAGLTSAELDRTRRELAASLARLAHARADPGIPEHHRHRAVRPDHQLARAVTMVQYQSHPGEIPNRPATS